MCLCPVTIRNPKYKNDMFLKSVDKEFISVPCGHCSECQQKRVNELVVRGYYEWLDCVSNGGFAIFDTLTFSDINCPTYNGWRYFSRRVFTLFIKRLYSNLEYEGYDVRGNLRYILTTEYGETSYRVHGHFLPFSKVPGLTPEKLNEHIIRAWRNTESGESIGRNDLEHDVSKRVINSVYGIRYVCKYMAKDSSILNALEYHYDSELSHFFFNVMRDEGKSKLSQFTYGQLRQIFLTYKYTHDVPKDYDLFNFTMLSHGLGMYYLQHAKIDDLLNDIVIQDQSDKEYTVYNVPSYYLRKVFYNYNKYSKRYIPNEYYDLLKRSNDKKIFDGLVSNQRKIEDIFNVLSPNIKSRLFQKYGCTLENNNDNNICVQNFNDYVNNLLNGRTIEHFVKYVVYFRNVHLSPYLMWLYESELETLDDSFIDVYCEYRNDALIHDELLFRTDIPFVSHPELYRTNHFSIDILFNQLSYFDGYDNLYNFLKDILYYYKRAKDYNYQKFKNEIKKFHAAYKQQFNSSIIFN